MGRQLNIRSDRAYELATRLAAERGTPVARVVEEALDALAAADAQQREASKQAKLKHWMELLEEGWKHLDPDCDFKIEDLYDPETGLPV
jgi:hypothetical protein